MKNLKNLLAKLENLSEANTDQVTNLNSVIAQKIQGGKLLPTKNGVCDGTNGTCTNDLCQGSTNTTCGNTTCFA